MSLALITALVATLQGEGATTFEKVATACSRYAWGAETAESTLQSFTRMGFTPTGDTSPAPMQEFVLGSSATTDRLFFLDSADPFEGQTGLKLCLYYPAHQNTERLRQQILTLSPQGADGMEREPIGDGTGWLYGDQQLRLVLRLMPDETPPGVSFTGHEP